MNQKVFFVAHGEVDSELSLSPIGQGQMEKIGKTIKACIPDEYIKQKKVRVCFARDQKPSKEASLIISRHLGVLDKKFPAKQLRADYQGSIQQWLDDLIFEFQDEIIIIIASPEVIKSIAEYENNLMPTLQTTFVHA